MSTFDFEALIFPALGTLLGGLLTFIIGGGPGGLQSARAKFNIQPPETQLPIDTKLSKSEQQEWKRTYRAYMNHTEWYPMSQLIFWSSAFCTLLKYNATSIQYKIICTSSLIWPFLRFFYYHSYRKSAQGRVGWFIATVLCKLSCLFIGTYCAISVISSKYL